MSEVPEAYSFADPAPLDGIGAVPIGWLDLEHGVYLHVADDNATEVLIVGLARADTQACNVLLVY
ncbi:hypothetical protein [Limnohabitans sp. 15K]|uniref:hypothetical protein n=1 Tax=Limnohabitans sp. 15K TaxID=1100706 RepID=UPI000C1F5956|nr:hypothetical protein [Limnohabitans sp. 15K]PIT81350.1 hypothetical protein B9Z40_11490 [Limnohabitans sp. 15K]